ncbi:MAG TPA: hypothetical protein VF881_13640 [Polyangiaceae bacterium]
MLGVRLAVVALLCCASCSAPWSVRAARTGNLGELKTAIARERAEGKLDRGRVRDIAKEVGAREIRTAPAAQALVRIEEARACTAPLSSALENRARASNDVGAAATLALLDGSTDKDKDGDERLRRYGASSSALWRAVAARAALGPRLGSARRKFYLDPDERVRLAALRAALEVADRADSSALLEVARLDPNPVAQAVGARALGNVANAEAVLGLRDLYAHADEGLRQSIVDAWGQKEAAAAGGLRELLRVVESERGAPAIEAGRVLLNFERERDAVAIGTQALVRAMTDGLARDRELAIANAPVRDRQVLDALEKVARGGEVSVRAAALRRLAEVPAKRPQALLELRAMAKQGVREAQIALARAGEREFAAVIAKDLSSSSREARLSAMRELVALGEFARAADLLADSDSHVRMSASCVILGSRED